MAGKQRTCMYHLYRHYRIIDNILHWHWIQIWRNLTGGHKVPALEYLVEGVSWWTQAATGMWIQPQGGLIPSDMFWTVDTDIRLRPHWMEGGGFITIRSSGRGGAITYNKIMV